MGSLLLRQGPGFYPKESRETMHSEAGVIGPDCVKLTAGLTLKQPLSSFFTEKGSDYGL